jgi:hypothetical protein
MDIKNKIYIFIMAHEVTIFIQGHGSEDYTMSLKQSTNLNLLSFCGQIGALGEMKIENGIQLDIAALNIIKNYYKNHLNDTQDEKLQGISYELPILYKRFGITFSNGGFKITQPVNQRTFFLTPNEHENCRICTEFSSGICLESRTRNVLCPEYGITVVNSSDPQDISFTLDTIKEGSPTKNVNINMSLSNFTHWKNKIINLNKKQQFEQKIINEKEVTLTELISFFQSMGFAKINIIDPTCRECCDIGKLKAIVNTVIEQKRIKEAKSLVDLMLPTTAIERGSQTSPATRGISPQVINRDTDDGNDKNENCFMNCLKGVCQRFCSKKKTLGGRIKKKFTKRKSRRNKTKKNKKK